MTWVLLLIITTSDYARINIAITSQQIRFESEDQCKKAYQGIVSNAKHNIFYSGVCLRAK
jgi:hypothetical protein